MTTRMRIRRNLLTLTHFMNDETQLFDRTSVEITSAHIVHIHRPYYDTLEPHSPPGCRQAWSGLPSVVCGAPCASTCASSARPNTPRQRTQQRIVHACVDQISHFIIYASRIYAFHAKIPIYSTITRRHAPMYDHTTANTQPQNQTRSSQPVRGDM